MSLHKQMEPYMDGMVQQTAEKLSNSRKERTSCRQQAAQFVQEGQSPYAEPDTAAEKDLQRIGKEAGIKPPSYGVRLSSERIPVRRTPYMGCVRGCRCRLRGLATGATRE